MDTQKNQTINSLLPSHPMASFKAARGLLSALCVPEMRRWLCKLMFLAVWRIELVLQESLWRREYQAWAQYYHYQKRSHLIVNDLQL